ncbi:SET domain-containing protein [Trametes cingulata]|nr:SET domain-containing protein [Trametes cingulata]
MSQEDFNGTPNPHGDRNPSEAVKYRFREVWKDYYSWEPEYCASRLSGLSVAQPSRPGDHSVAHEDADGGGHPNPSGGTPGNPPTLQVYTTTAGAWHCSAIELQTNLVIYAPKAYPVYESCAPASQNILHGDDPNYMPFVPHADDPTFDHEDHVLEYKGLAWQESYRDPDTLEITLETARRLHSLDGLSISEMDETALLPLTLQTKSVWGAIWNGKHSDMIVWTGSSATSCSALPDVPPPSPHDLRGRLQDYLNLWCPTADCLQAHCFSHNVEQVDLSTSRPFYQAEVPFRTLEVASECGPDCVKARGSSHEEDVRWTSQDISELRTLCLVASSATPCELAVLCRKPCHEVAFVLRTHDDFYVVSKRPQVPQRALPVRKSDFGSECAPDFVPNDPCSHPGPCGPDADCACFLNRAHCSRNCRCSPKCPRRWQGCKCALVATKASGKVPKGKSERTCAGNQCPCWAAKRECDPELCYCCRIRLGACRNVQIQQGWHKLSEVKRGKFGLGFFLVEEAKEGDLITEYIGELIYEPTFLCRGQVAAHVGRSYVFGLNNLMSVDATTSGNSARFINHAPSRRANVAVSILLVNGHHRIGVFAKRDIAAGSEIFMDYGPEYPIHEPEPEKS